MVESVFTPRYHRMRRLLVDARKKQCVSQAALAEKLGRAQTFVSKYERGERRLDLVEFLAVTEALSLDALKLVRLIQSVEAT